MVIGLPSLDSRGELGRRPGESRDGSDAAPMSPVRISILVAMLALIVVMGLIAWPDDDADAGTDGDAGAAAPITSPTR